MSFTMRTTRPGAGNKYYITKAAGGWSNAIVGSPTDSNCNVLANCVGYAYGRFNEIGGYGSCKYLSPVNAENFIQYKGSGLTVGQTPKVGACMVWQKGATLSGDDGAGHVAIVEKVNSSSQIITSESGYGSSTPFWTQTRNKGDGNWGQGSAYTFLGFIYNPAVDSSGNVEASKYNLCYGMEGDYVKELQEALIKLGYSCGSAGADGDFGANTLTALRQFQAAKSLTVDGIAGSQTWAKIEELLENKTVTTNITGTASTGSTTDEKTIWNFFLGKIGNEYGVAGLMGNLYAESALRSNNLQNSYEKSLGYTDETYTAAVDNGTYSNFIKDSAGYGLAQWTYWSRKEALLQYAKSQSKSVGDLTIQLEYLYKELSESYKTVLNTLKNATSVLAASNIVLLQFEKPANQSETVQNTRLTYSNKYYTAYATSSSTSNKTTVVTSSMKYSDSNKPLQCMMTQSTCYKGTSKMTVKGILWHSTGANNTTLKRYVQPDDNASNRAKLLAKIGTNTYGNDWNHQSVQAGLNAWIGTLADGSVTTVQTMPWDYKPWGCGSGSKGSCNNGWIQFEICEDGLSDKSYLMKVYEEAAQLTAYLCKMYNLDPKGTTTLNGVTVPIILCHQDSYQLGLGSNHGDILHWFPKYGISMDTIRARVAEIMGNPISSSSTTISDVNTSDSSSSAITSTLEAGALVSIADDAVYWSGKSIPTWVKSQNWYVYSVASNGRVVINQNEKKTNTIMSPIDQKYLTVVDTVSTFTAYRVRVTAAALNYRAGAGTNNTVKGCITDKGVYTIVAEATDASGTKWGKLKSGAGWICLTYTTKL